MIGEIDIMRHYKLLTFLWIDFNYGKTRNSSPQDIFSAQELILKTQCLDYGNKSKAAMKQYLEAAKFFTVLLK